MDSAQNKILSDMKLVYNFLSLSVEQKQLRCYCDINCQFDNNQGKLVIFLIIV